MNHENVTFGSKVAKAVSFYGAVRHLASIIQVREGKRVFVCKESKSINGNTRYCYNCTRTMGTLLITTS